MKTLPKHWTLAASLSLAFLAGCQNLPADREVSTSEPVRNQEVRFQSQAIDVPVNSVNPQAVDPGSIPTAKPVAAVKQTTAELQTVVPVSHTLNHVLPHPVLTLDAAIAISLNNSPTLVALRSSEPVAHAAYHVAEVYPWNPQFQTQVLPYSRDRDGNDGAISQQHVIVQTFELGGQRQYREGAAAATWRQVNGTIRQAELMNASQTTRLFFSALYQRELGELGQLMAELNEQLVGVIERREKAGQSNNADVELARLQALSSRCQERLAEAGYQTALMNLRNQLNLDAYTPMELTGQWVDWRWRSLDTVIAGNLDPMAMPSGTASTTLDDATLRRLAAARPDVVAARWGVAMASENVRLADAMRRPNLQMGPMYQRDDSSTQFWGVQAQIDIPVVNTGVPLVRQRITELRQQQITATQLENLAVLEARAAIRRYEQARWFVEQSRGGFARDISDALKPFEDQFKAGQITLLQVYAARTALAQSRQSFLDLLNELALATADVTQATGLPPQQLITDGELLPAVP